MDITLLVAFLAFFGMVGSWVMLPTDKAAEPVTEMVARPSASKA
jgi:hypothetical protein